MVTLQKRLGLDIENDWRKVRLALCGTSSMLAYVVMILSLLFAFLATRRISLAFLLTCCLISGFEQWSIKSYELL